MFLTSLRKNLDTLAFRLTVFYGLLFGFFSCAGMILVYFAVVDQLQSEIDKELIDTKIKLSYYVANEDIETIKDEFIRDAEAVGTNSVVCRLLSTDGEILVSSDTMGWSSGPLDPIPFPKAKDSNGLIKTQTWGRDQRKTRTLSVEVVPGKILQIGIALDKNRPFLMAFRNVSALIWLVMLAISTAVGMRIARKALAGVEEVSKVASRITEGQYDGRVNVTTHGEEIAQLGRTFNRMAAHVQKLMNEMQEVNDNIAHDLRSPIARMRAMAESAVIGKTSLIEYEETAASIVDECDRLLHTVNTILDISEVEAGVGRRNLEEIDLVELLDQAVSLFQPLADEREIRLQKVVEIKAVPVIYGERGRLQRTLSNLIDNAVKFTEDGGTICVFLQSDEELIRLAVRDTGCGIPEAEMPVIFERFRRGDSSRNQPGNGLGLSFANAVTKAHGGHIAVESTPGQGSTFTLVLPQPLPGETHS